MARQSWNFDLIHSSINFTIRHLVVSKVHGRFQKWSGTLETDEANPAASVVSVEIDANSIDTHDANRDAHLRTGDFFEVERFPTLTFKSTGVDKVSDTEYRLTGDLTIRGVARPVTLDVEYAGTVKDPWGGDRAGFTARTSISRKEFGITFNQVLEAGGVALGDKVDINIDVEAVKAVAVPA